MPTKNLSWVRNPLTDVLDAFYPAINPINSWKIAAPYRLDHAFDMIAVHPRHNDAGSMAYFKWADTNSEYVCRPSWFGGEPPFRLTLLSAPAGMTIGGGTEQTFTRTLSAHAGVYIHSLPNDYATIRWQPTAGQHGNTYSVRLLVEDQTGGYLIFRWSVTVDDTKFKYFDAAGGNNANAGTFEAPYQTFGYGYASVATPQNYIFKYKAGTYNIHNGTSGNDAAFNSTHCKSHIGIAAGVIFDVSGGNFSGGTDDIYIANVKITGGRTDKANVRQIDIGSKSARTTLNRIAFDTTELGTQSTVDNPCGYLPADLSGANYHEYMSMTDCTLSATSKAAMAVLFSVKNYVVENCESVAGDMAAIGSAMALHLKGRCYNGTTRFSDLVCNAPNGVMWVSNQTPADCLNTDINYCRLTNTTSTTGAVIRLNSQALSGSKPVGQYVQRCSLAAATSVPLKMEDYIGGDDVNYGGILWQGTSSTIDGGSTGGTSLTTASAKVADINSLASGDIGVRGWVIASTFVS